MMVVKFVGGFALLLAGALLFESVPVLGVILVVAAVAVIAMTPGGGAGMGGGGG